MIGVLIGNQEKNLRNKIIDEETFEIAKDNDLSLDEVEELQEFKDDTGFDTDEALEAWKDLPKM